MIQILGPHACSLSPPRTKELGEERDRLVNTQVETLKEGQARLTNMIQESMNMAEGLYDRVSQGYDDLKGELQGT